MESMNSNQEGEPAKPSEPSPAEPREQLEQQALLQTYKNKVNAFIKTAPNSQEKLARYGKINAFLSQARDYHEDIEKYAMYYAASGELVPAEIERFDLQDGLIRKGIDAVLSGEEPVVGGSRTEETEAPSAEQKSEEARLLQSYTKKVEAFINGQESHEIGTKKITDVLEELRRQHPDIENYKMYHAVTFSGYDYRIKKLDLLGNKIQQAIDDLIESDERA